MFLKYNNHFYYCDFFHMLSLELCVIEHSRGCDAVQAVGQQYAYRPDFRRRDGCSRHGGVSASSARARNTQS